MQKLLVVTPVKDSISHAEQAIRSIMQSAYSGSWDYVVYDDFSSPETSARLDLLASELGFRVVHLCDVVNTPSPNYRYVLQAIQQQALASNSHVVLVESDVVVRPDTFHRLASAVADNVGLVAAVTVDDHDAVNFPYLYARKWPTRDLQTRRRLSFCCTLLSLNFLRSYDFAALDPTKNWYDVFISHRSLKLGFRNLLQLTNRVVHYPHSSRPWKLLKYTNPLKYYWIKYTKGFDKI